ncbi:MAG: hypothetical protein HY868_18410 [Chloroflexi bacterium]|nr:hypothetical protein [Chloroflexota bacterium]
MTDTIASRARSTKTTALVLSIEHDQRIDLAADGTAVRGYETYIREYVGMIESGLMARMSNAAYKILHALALRARILGDPRRLGAEDEFAELVRLGIVSKEDKGHLFCFPSRERLMQDTGMGSVHTVDAALDELADSKLVKRITPAQPRITRGLFGSNFYIIYPESFIGKFGATDGEQKLLPVEDTESSLRHSENCTLKNKDCTTTTTLNESTDISQIVEFFARAIGIKQYAPTEKETRLLDALLREGFSIEQIENGITRAVAYAREKNRTAHLSFCARFVRHPEESNRESESDRSKSSGEIVTENGKSSAQIVPVVSDSGIALFEELGLTESAREEMVGLIALIEEHSGQPQSKALVKRWKALADEFREFATQRGVTSLALVRQAVEEALDAGSAKQGFCAPKMARIILARWAKENAKTARQKVCPPKREIPLAVQVYRQVRRRYPAQELWDTIAQTVGTDEAALGFWRDALKAWVGRGYNPMNVTGPLEWFKRREISKNGNPAPTTNGMSQQRPIETLETIQARLRLAARAQEISNQTEN